MTSVEFITSMKNTLTPNAFHSVPDLSGPAHYRFVSCQFVETDRAPGVQFLSADSDFRTHSKLKAVGESGGGVHVDAGGVDFAGEALRVGEVLSDDRFGVCRTVFRDVVDSVIKRIDHANRKNQGVIFGFPIEF